MLRTCLFFLIVLMVPFAAAQAPYAPLNGPLVLTEDFKMTGADADSIASVGWSVGTAGMGTNAFIVAGAFRDGTFGPETGAAYVFRFDGSDWIEEQKLLASDAHANDSFGQASSAYSGSEGDFAIIGAPKWPAFGRLGAAYVFRYDDIGSIWVEEDRLTVPNAVQDDALGRSVAVGNGLAVVSAPGEDGIGAAYAFHRESDGQGGYMWTEEFRFQASDTQKKDGFGRRVALSVSAADTLALIGTSSNVAPGGAAYVFRRQPNGPGRFTWGEEQKLVASDGEEFDNLGWAVAIAETSLGMFALIGAPGDNEPEMNRGSAYVFRRQPDGQGGYEWVEEDKLTASDGTIADAYGWSVSIADHALGPVAVVTTRSDDNFRGAGYVYLRQTNGTWIETAKMIASDAESGDFLGYSSAIGEDWVALGAPLDDPMGGPAGRGAMYAYDIQTVLTSTGERNPALNNTSVRIWPNPFDERVVVSYRLAEPGPVELAVFDVLGRAVVQIVSSVKPAGEHVESIELDQLPAGRYLIRLTTPRSVSTRMLTKVSSTH